MDIAFFVLGGIFFTTCFGMWIRFKKSQSNTNLPKDLEKRIKALEERIKNNSPNSDMNERISVLEDIVINDEYEFQKKINKLQEKKIQ